MDLNNKAELFEQFHYSKSGRKSNPKSERKKITCENVRNQECAQNIKKAEDFPDDTVVMTLPSNSRDAVSISSWGAQIPHALK